MSKSQVCTSVCLTLLVCVLLSSPVSAQTSYFGNMADCFYSSSLVDSFWFRTWHALDCEIEFVTCLRLAIFSR